MSSQRLLQTIFSTRLVPSGHYLPKKRGGQTYFAPFIVRPEGALAPPLPEIDSSKLVYCNYLEIGAFEAR